MQTSHHWRGTYCGVTPSFNGVISVPPEEGQLLSLLLKLMNAKKTIEVGVFTGYLLLATSLALPKDDKERKVQFRNSGNTVGEQKLQPGGSETRGIQ